MPKKPPRRPHCPHFSSGPCRKYPGFDLARLKGALLGRSHRSVDARAKLQAVLAGVREILRLPHDYAAIITPASDTGAMEMAMWSLLGARPTTIAAWDAFGRYWLTDATQQLRITAEVKAAPWGEIVPMEGLDYDRDIVFTWNGTTSGVRVPPGTHFPPHRQGLTICDATSAAFGMDLPWDSLDATTFSWQKLLGGEAAHGMLILSPRALARLEEYTPPWPMPKVFRLKEGDAWLGGLFDGATINTPSMLVVEDMLQALAWARDAGGLDGLIRRTTANAEMIWDFCEGRPWLNNLARHAATRSTTSVCLTIDDPDPNIAANIARRLEDEGVAFDINAYRDAPPGLRIWCGATVEATDIAALLPWIEWGYEQEKSARP